jgi:hypothetical protein
MSIGEKVRNAVLRQPDPRLAIARGHVPGVSQRHLTGRHTTLSASLELLGIGLTLANSLQDDASTVRIRSGGNANDTAAGSGARSVIVEGLDANFNEITATIATNGTLASSATVASFRRVTGARVAEVGTYNGVAAANIVIERTDDSTAQATIVAADGVARNGLYTVPAGYTAYVAGHLIRTESGKTPTVGLYSRQNNIGGSTPYAPRILRHAFPPGTSLDEVVDHATWEVYPAGTDIFWLASIGGGGAVIVEAEIELFLVENGQPEASV